MDVINCAKFYRNRLRGLDFVGSNFDHSHRNAMSLLKLLELTFRCDADCRQIKSKTNFYSSLPISCRRWEASKSRRRELWEYR